MRSTRSPSWIERLAGFGPVSVPPHVFALEASSLRYGRFVRADSGFEFEAFAEVTLPPDLFPEGPMGGPAHEAGPLSTAIEEALAAQSAPVEGGVSGASVVLPDAWVRVAFAELEEVPRSRTKLVEMLLWKLKRTVPFRVEDLRLDSLEVQPLPGAQGSRRWLLCFAVESLLSQVEEVFERHGIRVGQIASSSLATAAAVHEVAAGEELTGLVTVAGSGYSLTFLRHGEPVLHRYRPLGEDLDERAVDLLAVRDLKLTRTFLRDQLSGATPTRILLAAQSDVAPTWTARLEEGLGGTVVALGREQLPLRGQLPETAMHRVAPLLGAACQEAA